MGDLYRLSGRAQPDDHTSNRIRTVGGARSNNGPTAPRFSVGSVTHLPQFRGGEAPARNPVAYCEACRGQFLGVSMNALSLAYFAISVARRVLLIGGDK